jgi:acetyl-CoA decarbonylase/synthase complex subunit gamma
VVGALCAALTCLVLERPLPDALGWVLLPTALASYLAMNFTGASTFSNPSGVRKELRYAIPAQLVVALAGLLLIVLL